VVISEVDNIKMEEEKEHVRTSLGHSMELAR
jgi:hypothetical protein